MCYILLDGVENSDAVDLTRTRHEYEEEMDTKNDLKEMEGRIMERMQEHNIENIKFSL